MRRTCLLVLTVLALFAAPVLAQDTSAPLTQEQKAADMAVLSKTYSEANRTTIGCQEDAWATIIEFYASGVEHRKMEVALTDDLHKHILACSDAAQTMRLKRLSDALNSFKSGDFDKGKASLGAAEYLSLISSGASETDGQLEYNGLHEAFDTESNAYLALVDKYNELVVVLNRMPRETFTPTFILPRTLNCRSFSYGTITDTTCQ